MLKNTAEFETVVEGEMLLHPSSVNLTAVTEKLAVKPDLLARTFVVLEGGLYKLVIPGETEGEEGLTVLTLSEKDLPNARGLEAKLEKAAQTVGYDGGAAVAVVTTATKLMAEAYVREKRRKATSKDLPFGPGASRLSSDGGFIESAQMVMVRPFSVFSERGLQAAKDISAENWERLVLEAMAANDDKRMGYLARQAARALETTGAMGIEGDWRQLYENSMRLEVGPGNYPSLDTRQGLLTFMTKVYFPVVAALLSAAEIASTMGDHQAVMETAKLKAQMEIVLAEQAANAAEKVQPAKARTETARIIADADIAEVLGRNGDVLQMAKKIRARLAAATVVSPVIHAAGEMLEAGSEAAPAVFKGYAQFWDRWLKQTGTDPKLVGSTTAGLTVGIVASFWLGLIMIVAVPAAAAAGYMAFKGFRAHSEEE